jgi:rod shape-determining protein MreB and related proteins
MNCTPSRQRTPGHGDELAIDLGTSSTLFYLRGRGIVLNEPSVVALRREEGQAAEVLASGRWAEELCRRAQGSIGITHPIREGVIYDLEATALMLQSFLKICLGYRAGILRRILIAAPRSATAKELSGFREVARLLGTREVALIEEPMAAAIGSNLPVRQSAGQMIVDVGSGITEAAVLSDGHIVHCRSIRTGGRSMDQQIVDYIRIQHRLCIEEGAAERLKIQLLSRGTRESSARVKGVDADSGLQRSILITAGELEEVLRGMFEAIAESVLDALDDADGSLASDIGDRGIALTGGGSLLRALDPYLRRETGLPVFMVPDPLSAVALGNGRVLSGTA